MHDTDKVSRILAARAKIEDSLAASGIIIDAQVRDTIGWQMRAYVDGAGVDINEAAARVLEDQLGAHQRAA